MSWDSTVDVITGDGGLKTLSLEQIKALVDAATKDSDDDGCNVTK